MELEKREIVTLKTLVDERIDQLIMFHFPDSLVIQQYYKLSQKLEKEIESLATPPLK